MVASEAAPFAKTGGLADVLGALPGALGRLGHDVDVIIPRYRGVSAGEPQGEVRLLLDGAERRAAVYAAATSTRTRALFVEAPEYFNRDELYGTSSVDYADNAMRFGFLAHAALAYASSQQTAYDVVHAHDWQAGLVPALAARASTPLPTVFTIHNLAYQGVFDASWLPRIGLGPDMLDVDAMEYWGRISFLKAGINFAQTITTVSPRYAKEIQTPELGFGFDGILRRRARDLVGILNGIDYDQWNPQHDVHLPEPFSASNLAGKRAAKHRVLEILNIPVTPHALARPMVGMISRLVDQKGFDLIAALGGSLARHDATFALLGSGERRYENFWRALASQYPDRFGVHIGFDERLAHLIEGGADIFLMPSRFEPCGLNQMYSLRYGTVPVVRAVGGLYDTVRNYDERTGDGTGFIFEAYTPVALEGALRRALQMYPIADAWAHIQQAGMGEDHSWDTSARQYVDVYKEARHQATL
jgi:starch synthase